MLNPNDAAYILQQVYPAFLRYNALSRRERLGIGDFSKYLEEELRLGFGQQLLIKGSLFYMLFGAINRARDLLGGGDDSPARRRTLLKNAVEALERARNWLRSKGRMREFRELQMIIADTHNLDEMTHNWPAFSTAIKIYSQDLQTLEGALNIKLDLVQQRLSISKRLARDEDRKDLCSLLEIIRYHVAQETDAGTLTNAYRNLERFLLRYRIESPQALHLVASDALEELCVVCANSLRADFSIPGASTHPAIKWGLSESTFLALCVELGSCRDLETIDIDGKMLEKRLPPTAVRALAEVLAKNPKLKSIRLGGNQIPGPSWRPFASALAKLPHLQQLYMENNPLGESGADYLASGLHGAPELTSLHLNKCAIDNNGINTLSEALSTIPYLQFLHLMHNHISEMGCIGIAQLLRAGHLRELSLDHCPLGDQGAHTISTGLAKSKHLRKLHLRSCDISNSGVSSLRNAEQNCKHSIDIALEGNQIESSRKDTLDEVHVLETQLSTLLNDPNDVSECKRIIAAILRFSRYDKERGTRIRIQLLEDLSQGMAELQLLQSTEAGASTSSANTLCANLYQTYLRFHPEPLIGLAAGMAAKQVDARKFTQQFNSLLSQHQLLLGKQGARVLGQILEKGWLQSLVLEGQEIGASGMDALARGLARTRTLMTLDIIESSLGDAGLVNLGLGLLTNHSLRRLKLVKTGAQAKGFNSLAQSISDCGQLRKLWVSEKDLSDEGTAALIHGLQSDRGLDSLALELLELGPKAGEALESLLARHPKLRTLRIISSTMDQEAVQHIADGLKQNKALTKLCLSHCGVTDEGAAAIDESLDNHPCFKYLDLQNNLLTEGGKSLLQWRSELEYFKKF